MSTLHHPGTVKMVDMFSNTTNLVSASEMPEDRRFVYFKDDVEVSDLAEATEIVPVVEVRMSPLSAKGALVSKDEATTIRIQEFGPGGRPLRWAIMKK